MSETAPIVDERMEILRLVASQDITADEAARLLDAIDRTNRRIPEVPDADPFGQFRQKGKKHKGIFSRNVRIRITRTDSGEERFNLVLPIGFVTTGLNMVKRLKPNLPIDTDEVRDAIESGTEQTLLDIVDEGERLEILVEGL